MTRLTLCLAAMLLSSNFSASPPPATSTTLGSPQVTAIEQQFVDLVNSERWDQNLRVLATNPTLVQVAREHSREMAELDYFSHTSPSPDLRTPMKRYLHTLGHTPASATLAENLFYCSIVDVQLGHKCLMESPLHKENILDPRFEQMGVGVYIGKDGRFWVTQMFLVQTD